MIHKLIEVLEIQSYTGKDSLMREYLAKELAEIPGITVYENQGNIYVTKGCAPYPCVVSHIDTVHKIVENLTAITIGRNITGFNTVTMEQTGIGGDDKVGVFVCLQMLKEHDDIKVAFFRDEEIGCIGSGLADTTWFDDVTIVLQCDRRGKSDFVTRAGWTELSSKAFQDAVLPILTNHGYKFSDGMMTDIQELFKS
jgi:tripeptide aminopeptidase